MAGSVFVAGSRRLTAAFASGWRSGGANVSGRKGRRPPRSLEEVFFLRCWRSLAVGSWELSSSSLGLFLSRPARRHWPITEWILNTGMERSVATHSLGIDPPDLDNPDLVLKGAGHYEIGCRPCHGVRTCPSRASQR